MERRTAIVDMLVAGAVLLSGRLSCWARGDEPSDFVIRSDVRLVLLDVSVKDNEGGFVYGLSKDDFEVDENGIPQKITIFADNDIPVTVGLLVDSSRSMAPKRNEVMAAATAFIAGSNPRDEIFVLNFNETVKRGLPKGVLFSDNWDQLRAALYRGMPEGRTALNDAIMDGLEQLQLGKRDKKTLVLISDGGDNTSTHTHRQMMDAVEHSIATIYTVGIFEEDDPDRNPGLLKQLARISGGQAYFPNGAVQLTAACRGIAKDIRTRYTVGYQPLAQNGGPVRHIQVHVSAPGRAHLIARTRTSYLYNQPATQTGGPAGTGGQ